MSATLEIRRKLSDSQPGDTRRRSTANGGEEKILCVGGCPARNASYWVPMTEGRKPLRKPVDCEPQRLMDCRSQGRAPIDCFVLYDSPPFADHKEVFPELEDLADDVIEWTTPQQKKALLAGRRVFTIKECGDPYSSHYEATEVHTTGFVYQGNLPHLSKVELENYLRRHYPGCLVSRE